MVYSRRVGDRELTFGVSGRLYRSNVLLYDHQSESLWSQLLEKAVTGRFAGDALVSMPALRVSWRTWRRRHPGTLVLSTETGYRRNYQDDPYEGYYRTGSIWFPVGPVRRDLSPKTRVLGVHVNGRARAYPVTVLQQTGGAVVDEFDGLTVVIDIDGNGEIVSVRDVNDRPLVPVYVYWFAWQAFYPDTTVYTR
jgi:hypothetical protein